MKKIQIVMLSLCLLSACSPKVDSRGYVSDADWKTHIVPGKTGRDEVLALFGSPSSRSSFGTETWYYISARKEATAFLKPEVAEQDVLRVEFDQAGLVSKAEAFNKESSRDVPVVKRITPTEGHQLGFFEQLLGNIGRFNRPDGGDTAVPGRRPGN